MKEIIIAIGIISGGFFGLTNIVGSSTDSISKQDAITYFEKQTYEKQIVKSVKKYVSPSGYKGYEVILKEKENILGMGSYDTWILTSGSPDDPVRISPAE